MDKLNELYFLFLLLIDKILFFVENSMDWVIDILIWMVNIVLDILIDIIRWILNYL